MTTIVWSMTTEYDHRLVDNQEVVAESWVDCADNADAAVGEIVAKFWVDKEDLWTSVFGGFDDGDVIVTVHSPESISGEYVVDLTRPVQASARRKRV